MPYNHAEKAGFEPANRFGRLHAFQACLFSHSSISPRLCNRAASNGKFPFCGCKGKGFRLGGQIFP